MNIHLHANATTTPKTRCYIQASAHSVMQLGERALCRKITLVAPLILPAPQGRKNLRAGDQRLAGYGLGGGFDCRYPGA